jgi:hypothetical protein
MARPNLDDARCVALFASSLQQSDVANARAVGDAIEAAVRLLGADGCACYMAQEYGDHPEEACQRMRWARDVINSLPAQSAELV